MILVTGTIVARSDSLDALLALSLEHVHRSRQEPGCRSHAVYRDAENPNRLFFFEEWEDMPALETHFAAPASRDFVRQARTLAGDLSPIRIYEASEASR